MVAKTNDSRGKIFSVVAVVETSRADHTTIHYGINDQ